MLHPGSTHLHIGLSTDPTPHSIPHLIAYRGKAEEKEGGVVSGDEEKEGYVYRDESLVLQHCNEITVSGCSISSTQSGTCTDNIIIYNIYYVSTVPF